MSVDDLTNLPHDVRVSAQVYDNGEVSWPIEDAEQAIRALSDAGFVILGIDMRRVDDDGGIWEVAWSSFEPSRDPNHQRDNVVRAREAALEALARPDASEFGDRVLITWNPQPIP